MTVTLGLEALSLVGEGSDRGVVTNLLGHELVVGLDELVGFIEDGVEWLLKSELLLGILS